MSSKTIIAQPVDIDVQHFWKGIEVYLHYPHVVNRRINVFLQKWTAKIVCESSDLIRKFVESPNPCDLLSNLMSTDIKSNLVGISVLEVLDNDISTSLNSIKLSTGEILLSIKELIPRKECLFSSTLEFAVIDKQTNSVTFLYHPVILEKQSLGPVRLLTVQYNENKILSISVEGIDSEKDASVEWLRENFFLRFIKWMTNKNPNSNSISGSLVLISPEQYVILYNKLKQKYGAHLRSIWSECTDPAKFIYEDIAIASYLLLLWKKEREETGMLKLQSFLDLGCGNGLLVYILSNEGHEGRGTDLRKRKIWDLYPKSTHLHVESIVPSSSTVYPDVDWIIGNHSDELTPWIPVIAARSSYDCRFFLLPCCTYEFNGAKYRRNSAAQSQYTEYISYIKMVCDICGFKTNIDKLRIPSTKRTCLIGWGRTYSKNETDVLNKRIEDVIRARTVSCEIPNQESSELWCTTFKPRNAIEKVRNCTQLNSGLISDIIHIVSQTLLENGNRVPMEDRPTETWNAGQEIHLGELVKSVPAHMLNQLKNECGGLQTLLKNHSYIFSVKEGKVKFRIPGTEISSKKKYIKNKSFTSTKRKICWFYRNHPDGCPLSDRKCNYVH